MEIVSQVKIYVVVQVEIAVKLDIVGVMRKTAISTLVKFSFLSSEIYRQSIARKHEIVMNVKSQHKFMTWRSNQIQCCNFIWIVSYLFFELFII